MDGGQEPLYVLTCEYKLNYECLPGIMLNYVRVRAVDFLAFTNQVLPGTYVDVSDISSSI